MQATALIVWTYGVLVLAGGVIGWVKAKSKPSLIAGVLFGLLLIADGFWISRDRRHQGLIAGIVLSGTLLLLMGIRFIKTRTFMPAGLTATLSLVVVALLLIALAD